MAQQVRLALRKGKQGRPLPACAAKQGDVDGHYNLGVMYENSRAVRRDRVEALRWYRLAADQGDADARKALDRLR